MIPQSLILLFVLSGCGLDEQTINDAKATSAAFTGAKQHLTNERGRFAKEKAGSMIPNFVAISTREKLEDGYTAAEREMKEAGTCVAELDRLITQNDGDVEVQVKQRIVACNQQIAKATDTASQPMARVATWTELALKAGDFQAQAATTADTTEKAFEAQLGRQGALVASLQSQAAKYPNKRPDLEARVMDLHAEKSELARSLATVHAQGDALLAKSSTADIVVFETSLATVDETAGVIHEALEDLDSKARELDEEYALVLTKLEKTAAFKFHVTQWEWHSESYGDGSDTNLGWRTAGEDEWFATPEDKVIESTGSDYYSGSSTEIDDKDIENHYFATTYEVKNGQAGEPVRTEITEDEFEDYHEAVVQMEAVFSQGDQNAEGVMLGEHAESKHIDPDDPQGSIPVWCTMQVNNLAIEHKARGQYDDEANEAPTPYGSNLDLVGNEEYGRWVDDGHGGHSWFWHDYMLYRMLWGGSYTYVPGGYYPYGSYASYRRYSDWRSTSGWSNQYDNDGKYVGGRYTTGGYRQSYSTSDASSGTKGSSATSGKSVRGAGPSTRSRGLGGGGK